jgi:hypothetical protein
MSHPGIHTLGDVVVGDDPGWLLAFYRGLESEPFEEIGRTEYNAEISAALPSGLEGGVYTFTVEGLEDGVYSRIKPEGRKEPTICELFLYWRDTSSSVVGYMKNLAGLTDTLGQVKAKDLGPFRVARLRVVSVKRIAGARRYETLIKARELAFENLARKRLLGGGIEKPTKEAVEELLRRIKCESFRYHGLTPHTQEPCRPKPPEKEGEKRRKLKDGKSALDLLKDLGRYMEEETGRYGRGMYLIRDGTLHIGTRTIPLVEKAEDLMRLSPSNGLIHAEPEEPVLTDPNFDYVAKDEKDAPKRCQYKLTLKGRPDLKPGDVVQFVPPPEDGGTVPGVFSTARDLLGGPLLPSLREDFSNAMKLYVHSVEHRVGRKIGFVTTVSGVQIHKGEEGWDCHSPGEGGREAEGLPAEASAETAAARAIQGSAVKILGSLSMPEVGEVRQMNAKGLEEPPGQTLTVWSGLEDESKDGKKNQARRLPVERGKPKEIDTGVPYLTPFAWGQCGLVLPRYPGTRVFMLHRRLRSHDPVEAGALWESGRGPESRPGDWWLILPVGVPEKSRAALPDDQEPKEHTGKVTHDLVDAEGARVIEVGELTIRVGNLQNAGTRPQGGEEDGITLEHAGAGSKIVMKKDGTMVIEAAKDLHIKAANIHITVSGAMNVTKSQ